ncbi:MAG: phage tail tape measure protein [Pseudomonadota bacterium]
MDDFGDFGGLGDHEEAFNQKLAEMTSDLSGTQRFARSTHDTAARADKTVKGLETDIKGLERGVSRGLRRAIDGVVLDGMNLSDALKTVASSAISSTYSAALSPVTSHFGGLISQGIGSLFGGILPFANGAPFSQGKVMPFANGGIVSGPTTFPMRGGTGLMGEAGPEAIMPLTRGPDGKLGVASAGGNGGPTVVMNITTNDVQGFQRSQSQIAAQMSRALNAGARNR